MIHKNIAVDLLHTLETFFLQRGLTTNLVKSRKHLAVKLDDYYHVVFYCRLFSTGLTPEGKAVHIYRLSADGRSEEGQRPSALSVWKTCDHQYRSRSKLEFSFLRDEIMAVSNYLVGNFPHVNEIAYDLLEPKFLENAEVGKTLGYSWSKRGWAAQEKAQFLAGSFNNRRSSSCTTFT